MSEKSKSNEYSPEPSLGSGRPGRPRPETYLKSRDGPGARGIVMPGPVSNLGWATLVNAFYLPGAIAGAYISDWIGPRRALYIFVFLQGCVEFLMAGLYGILDKPANIAGFIIVYGISLSLGEAGPGDSIGFIASKTSATAIRGQYYAIPAACGKLGAFIGTCIFPAIQKNAPGGAESTRGGQGPFFVSSSLCLFSAGLAYFILPHISQDTIPTEDIKSREYLEGKR
ncbi:MAG: hypothetical protein Q9166_005611 [cf. Caloplaca sp. 2 TL-2023]